MCLPPKPRDLPEDPAALKALLRAAQAERDRAEQRAAEHAQRAEAQAALAQEKAALAAQQTQRADELYLENLRLQLQLERYQKWYYGPRADRLKTRQELGQALLRLRRGMGAETPACRRAGGERAGLRTAAGEAAPGPTRPGEL